MEDVVEAGVDAGTLQRDDIQRFFDDSDGARITFGVGADRTRVIDRDIVAGRAEAGLRFKVAQGRRQLERLLSRWAEPMVGVARFVLTTSCSL